MPRHPVSVADALAAYELEPELGALPQPDPLTALPASHAVWDDLAGELPRPLVASRTRAAVRELAELTIDGLDAPERERAMLLLSY